jgi:hypothetical protein
MSITHAPGRIDLKLRELAQLFNSLDPSPFLDRDLDRDAEEFIVAWARELPRNAALVLVVHLLDAPDPARAMDLEHAVRRYFATRADMKRREFRLLLRNGHVSLLIGLVFLTACLFASGIALRLAHAPTGSVLHEGFVIAGWVAMWRPLQTYLYDWWPVHAECRILQRLSRMRVRLELPRAPANPP